jgi:hypothetical protein
MAVGKSDNFTCFRLFSSSSKIYLLFSKLSDFSTAMSNSSCTCFRLFSSSSKIYLLFSMVSDFSTAMSNSSFLLELENNLKQVQEELDMAVEKSDNLEKSR